MYLDGYHGFYSCKQQNLVTKITLPLNSKVLELVCSIKIFQNIYFLSDALYVMFPLKHKDKVVNYTYSFLTKGSNILERFNRNSFKVPVEHI